MTIQKNIDIIDNASFYNLVFEQDVEEMLGAFQYDYKTQKWTTTDERFERATTAANAFLNYYNDGYLAAMLYNYGGGCDVLSAVEFYCEILNLTAGNKQE